MWAVHISACQLVAARPHRLTGRFDVGWLFAWILMTLCSVAFSAIKSATIKA
jgi:hypothetical protein